MKVKVIELHPINCGDMYYWNLSNIIDNTYNILPVKYKENGFFLQWGKRYKTSKYSQSTADQKAAVNQIILHLIMF